MKKLEGDTCLTGSDVPARCQETTSNKTHFLNVFLIQAHYRKTPRRLEPWLCKSMITPEILYYIHPPTLINNQLRVYLEIIIRKKKIIPIEVKMGLYRAAHTWNKIRIQGYPSANQITGRFHLVKRENSINLFWVRYLFLE